MLLRTTIPAAAQGKREYSPIIPIIPAGLTKNFPGFFLSRLAHLSVFSFYYNCVDMESTHRVLVKILTLKISLILVKFTIFEKLFWQGLLGTVIFRILTNCLPKMITKLYKDGQILIFFLYASTFQKIEFDLFQKFFGSKFFSVPCGSLKKSAASLSPQFFEIEKKKSYKYWCEKKNQIVVKFEASSISPP